MKKNSLKRVFSAVAVGALALSATAMTSLGYDRFDPFQKPNPATGVPATADEVANATVKPRLTLSNEVVTVEDGGKTVTIDINVADAGVYCATGMHIYYDANLSIAKKANGKLDIGFGDGASDINNFEVKEDEDSDVPAGFKSVFLTTGPTGDYGMDGTMWKIKFTLPDTLEEGAVYPLDIFYRASETNENSSDKFTTFKENFPMSVWTFAYGIYNSQYNNNFEADAEDIALCPALADIDPSYDGYIAVAGGAVTTTTTTVTTTVTTTTATTTVTTDDVTTTSKVAQLPDDGSKTTTKAVASSSSSKAPTTTSKGGSPQTGVTGVGVAVAGLAVALGTAFVLRKKED